MVPAALVVEDDVDWLDLLTEELFRSGYQPDWASDSTRALRRIDTVRLPHVSGYALAVVDLHLGSPIGQLAGRAVVESFIDRFPSARVAVVSGLTPRVDMEAHFSNMPNVAGVFEKNPFPLERFRSCVQLKGSEPVEDSAQRKLESSLFLPRLPILTSAWEHVEAATDSSERGRAFEAYVQQLLSSVPLFECVGERNRTASGEVDLVFEVRCIPGTLTQDWDSYLLVECKSGRSPVSSADVSAFAQKLRNARISVGIIATTAGIASRNNRGAIGEVTNVFQQEGIRILVLDQTEFVGSPRGGGNLYESLRDKTLSLRLLR